MNESCPWTTYKVIPLDVFFEWCGSSAPLLHVCLSAWCAAAFLPGLPSVGSGGPSDTPLAPPVALLPGGKPGGGSSILPPDGDAAGGEGGPAGADAEAFTSALWGLSLGTFALQGPWRRLYTSASDGFD
mmetsp:Transcript_52080/g.118704  ORF Transcript_52080/g.118704 Transcript_52080/m.118704 type:complete len:129 (+) Transcript_52080:43-429(+)